MKPKLIDLGNGKWVNPAFVVGVQDDRDMGNCPPGYGYVSIWCVYNNFTFNCLGGDDDATAAANEALAALGIEPKA